VIKRSLFEKGVVAVDLFSDLNSLPVVEIDLLDFHLPVDLGCMG
jgi:hypothetical protein